MQQSDDKIHASLMLSVGTRKKWRALDPIAAAKQIELMCKETSVKEIAKKLAVSTGTIRMFLNLLSLPDDIQELIRARKIGIDAGYRLTLITQNTKDQEALAKAIVGDEKLSSKEIRGIIQSLRKRNPNMPISDCIAIATKYRPIIEEEENVIVTGLGKNTFSQLKEKSEENGVSFDDLINKIAVAAVQNPNNLKLVKTIDSMLLIGLTKDGYSAFMTKAKELKVRPDDLIETLARGLL